MADQIITERPIKQQSGFNLNSYLLGLDADSYRILISDLAKKIVEDYSGSTLAGSAQAVKTALDSIDSTIGNTAMGTTATTITGAIAEHERDISGLNSKIVSTSQVITSFYDNRCENIAEAEKTFIMKFGSINIAVICVKMKTAVTSQQTSIFTLPSNYNSPASYQSYGVVYNSTTGKTYQAQVSSAGNVNIINRGELAVGDKLYGHIAWMA